MQLLFRLSLSEKSPGMTECNAMLRSPSKRSGCASRGVSLPEFFLLFRGRRSRDIFIPDRANRSRPTRHYSAVEIRDPVYRLDKVRASVTRFRHRVDPSRETCTPSSSHLPAGLFNGIKAPPSSWKLNYARAAVISKQFNERHGNFIEDNRHKGFRVGRARIYRDGTDDAQRQCRVGRKTGEVRGRWETGGGGDCEEPLCETRCRTLL